MICLDLNFCLCRLGLHLLFAAASYYWLMFKKDPPGPFFFTLTCLISVPDQEGYHHTLFLSDNQKKIYSGRYQFIGTLRLIDLRADPILNSKAHDPLNYSHNPCSLTCFHFWAGQVFGPCPLRISQLPAIELIFLKNQMLIMSEGILRLEPT